MEKSELRLEEHMTLPGHKSVEVWYQEELVATVYGAEGPGVRVISKHPMDIVRGGEGGRIGVIEVRMELKDG
jgi:hypothetical protein